MRAIYVAYHFPPTGGAGVQRTVRFTSSLPDCGIEPQVLAGPGPKDDRWTPADALQAAALPDSVEVRRAAGPEPATGSRAALQRWLRVPSPWTNWWRRQILEVGRTMDGDLVLCSMSPFESATAAARLAAELRIPWVADLRDPWALDEMLVWPTSAHRWLERRAMRRVLATADAVIMNTPAAASLLVEAFPELGAKRIAVIPNGFDIDDFTGPGPERLGDGFHIVHAGYLHTALGRAQRSRGRLRTMLGGSTRGADFLTRSHIFLLEAIDRLCARDPSYADRVHVWLAGVLSDADRAVIEGRPYVHALGYVSHARTTALMRSADLLFLPMQNLPAGTRASIVPGKTYEYLASGRPVLAAVPEGDARDLILQSPNAFACRPDDSQAMADVIAQLESGSRLPTLQRASVMNYERRALTSELATLLHDVVRASRSADDVLGTGTVTLVSAPSTQAR